MNILLDPVFLAVALTHFGIDLLNGQRAVLLAYLSLPLGLTNATLGAVSTAAAVTGSLSQPLFGYFSDRFGARWVVAGGLAWMALLYSLAVVTAGRLALLFLVLASLGSGAFHPAGTMEATYIGRARHDGRETTSTSYFFLLGQGGLFAGPLVGGLILASMGPTGLLLTTLFALPVVVNVLLRVRNGPLPRKQAENPSAEGKKRNFSPVLIGVLALLAAFRIWAQQNMIVFLPKYLSDLGYAPNLYGTVAALFMGGSALGNVAGGTLADRFGKRRVAMSTLLMASVPLAFLPSVRWLPWLFLLVPLAGMFTGASHSIVVVFAHRLIPGGMGLASGLILGFMFSSGSLGALLSGFLADLWGVPFVFGLSAALVVVAAGLALVLRETPAPVADS